MPFKRPALRRMALRLKAGFQLLPEAFQTPGRILQAHPDDSGPPDLRKYTDSFSFQTDGPEIPGRIRNTACNGIDFRNRKAFEKLERQVHLFRPDPSGPEAPIPHFSLDPYGGGRYCFRQFQRNKCTQGCFHCYRNIRYPGT